MLVDLGWVDLRLGKLHNSAWAARVTAHQPGIQVSPTQSMTTTTALYISLHVGISLMMYKHYFYYVDEYDALVNPSIIFPLSGRPSSTL